MTVCLPPAVLLVLQLQRCSSEALLRECRCTGVKGQRPLQNGQETISDKTSSYYRSFPSSPHTLTPPLTNSTLPHTTIPHILTPRDPHIHSRVLDHTPPSHPTPRSHPTPSYPLTPSLFLTPTPPHPHSLHLSPGHTPSPGPHCSPHPPLTSLLTPHPSSTRAPPTPHFTPYTTPLIHACPTHPPAWFATQFLRKRSSLRHAGVAKKLGPFLPCHCHCQTLVRELIYPLAGTYSFGSR